MSRQIVGIDFIRFFAALLVTLFHLGFWVASGPEAATPVRAASSPGLVLPYGEFLKHGYVGVDIFFVLSGFVIAYSAESASAYGFLKSRIIRLMPAIWIVAPLTFLVAWLCDFAEPLDLTKRLVRSLVLFPTGPWIDGSYWTLPIEVSFYACVFALLAVGRFEWIQRLALVLGLISGSYWIAALFGHFKPQWGDRLLELSLVHHGCFFALGATLWLSLIKGRNGSNLLILVLAGFCLLKLAVLHDEPLAISAIWLTSIIAIIASVKLNMLTYEKPRLRALARTLGLATYPLYLLHDLVGAALVGWLYRQGVDGSIAAGAAIFAAIVAAVIIARYLEPAAQRMTRSVIARIENAFQRCLSFKRSSVVNADGNNYGGDERIIMRAPLTPPQI
jgi:peptidoglycan/LPS O-acetylase OafA/YrhL